MKGLRSLLVAAVLLGAVAVAWGDGLPLVSAQGEVDKVGKDSLIIRPRTGKPITLRVTGTSKVHLLFTKTAPDGRAIPVQRETDIKDLQPRQPIAAIFTPLREGPVLLTAVVTQVEK